MSANSASLKAAPLMAVGIGPGDTALLAPQARAALEMADCVAGYQLYLDLLPSELLADKRRISSGMRQERERCTEAVDAALSGLPTALVSSGDAGIYAMAALALEILEERGLLETVPFSVIPGIPALCAAAALLGAPLGHDFACVSLSDLLTPIERIRQRLKAALEADFVCVLYNPRSHGRPDYLEMALHMAHGLRSPDCPVGMVRKAYRPGQEVILSTLAEADASRADMLSIVFIGNSESRIAGSFMLTPRGYSRKL